MVLIARASLASRLTYYSCTAGADPALSGELIGFNRVNFPTGKALSRNLDPIAYLPLQDKPAFKMALHKVAERWYCYCAHLWEAGWSVVEVTDPKMPRFVRFIEGPANIWTL